MALLGAVPRNGARTRVRLRCGVSIAGAGRGRARAQCDGVGWCRRSRRCVSCARFMVALMLAASHIVRTTQVGATASALKAAAPAPTTASARQVRGRGRGARAPRQANAVRTRTVPSARAPLVVVRVRYTRGSLHSCGLGSRVRGGSVLVLARTGWCSGTCVAGTSSGSNNGVCSSSDGDWYWSSCTAPADSCNGYLECSDCTDEGSCGTSRPRCSCACGVVGVWYLCRHRSWALADWPLTRARCDTVSAWCVQAGVVPVPSA